MKRLSVSLKESEGKKFYYLDFGSEAHGRKSFRVYIANYFVKKDEKGEYAEENKIDLQITIMEE